MKTLADYFVETYEIVTTKLKIFIFYGKHTYKIHMV